MYFDAVIVEVKTFLLLFRLALAILCKRQYSKSPLINYPEVEKLGVVIPLESILDSNGRKYKL